MIKMLVMDVDGTLTDGRIYISGTGEVMKAFDVKDGYAIINLKKNGITPVIITGRESEIVKERARELKIDELYQGVSDKLAQLKIVAEKLNINKNEIAYIGDDLNDLDCINYLEYTACPADAIDEVKEKVFYICHHKGGRGAAREFINFVKRGK